jgi:prefoldin subunit 5
MRIAVAVRYLREMVELLSSQIEEMKSQMEDMTETLSRILQNNRV